jgi:hypothetical protein
MYKFTNTQTIYQERVRMKPLQQHANAYGSSVGR